MSDNMHEILSPEELDAIGEIMNISMGSAATAVSTMLEKQVTITTPRMEQNKFRNIDSSNLEPALIIKIKYIEGIEGTNTTMLRRHDMQVILDILMGNEMPSSEEDFEFDDMSMSAACEVMNQMMGASATALSEILQMPINISTPEASLVESTTEAQEMFLDMQGDDPVVAISFNMMIKDVLDTSFISFLPIPLAKKIVNQVNGIVEEIAEEIQPIVEQPFVQMGQPPMGNMAEPPSQAMPVMEQTHMEPQAPFVEATPQQFQEPFQPAQFNQFNAVSEQAAAPEQAMPQNPMPQMNQAPQNAPQSQNTMPPQQTNFTQPMGMQGQMPPMQPYGTQGYPPYDGMPPQYNGAQQAYMQQMQGYYNYPPQQGGYAPPAVSVKKPEFPDFSQQAMRPAMPSGSNMNLLMGVHLEISVIIGRTKRKIKDIMDFGQGTVVELDKQTGAPAEIVVNGQLLAYGDVIVVGDNFGVRITEIVGSKDLMDLLGNNS